DWSSDVCSSDLAPRLEEKCIDLEPGAGMKDKAGAVTKRGAPMGGTMKKLLIATVSSLVLITAAQAEDIKIGIEMGFTGPIETLTPPMAAAAELAVKEVNDSGLFLDGTKISTVRGDETCIDAAHRADLGAVEEE